MALTLLEALKLGPDRPISDSIIQEFAMASLAGFIPIQDVIGNAYSYNREKTLPGVGFRGINEGFLESTGVVDTHTESLKIFGGDLDVDTFLINTQGSQVRSVHESLKIKALAKKWDSVFFKGDSTVDPRAFDGLQVRLSGDQLIDAGNTAGGDALSLSKLDELRDAVENPTNWAMNKSMLRLLSASIRDNNVAGQIEQTTDTFGRSLTMYAGLPILIVDKDNEGNQILDFNEANPNPGGGLDPASTSIYCMSLGAGSLVGLQGSISNELGISVRDLGELKERPVFRTRFEWYTGIALVNSRCAARLRGIKNAAVVS